MRVCVFFALFSFWFGLFRVSMVHVAPPLPTRCCECPSFTPAHPTPRQPHPHRKDALPRLRAEFDELQVVFNQTVHRLVDVRTCILQACLRLRGRLFLGQGFPSAPKKFFLRTAMVG